MSEQETRLLFLANTLQWGGAERTLMELASGLHGNGYRTKVLCFHGEGSATDGLNGQVPVEALGFPYHMRLRDLRRLRQAIARERPALVQCFHTGPNRWGPVAARMAGVKRTVLGLQNVFPGQTLRERAVDWLTFRMASCAVSCSEAVRRFHTGPKRLSAAKITTIHNGVDVDRFRPGGDRMHLRRELGLDEHHLLVGAVAHLTPQKGHRHLLEAARQVVQRLPETVFVLVGDGSLRPELEEMVNAWKLQENVRFLGVRRDIPELLGSLDLFVLPSVWEGLGVAVLEAMACELPVVASRVDGIVEMVVEGVTGLLAPPKDAEALHVALTTLLESPAERERMGLAGRERAVSRFSTKAMVERYRGIYEGLLERRAA